MSRWRPSGIPARSAILALCLVLVAVTPGSAAIGPGKEPGKAWIDTPLNGDQVPVQSLTVVAHATDHLGVVAMELYADGALAGSTSFTPSPGELATASFQWSAVPGGHWLAVRGKGTSGAWGIAAYAYVFVDVDLQPSATPTPTPSASASATGSGSPSPVASGPASGSPSASASSSPRTTPSPSLRVTPAPTPRVTPTPTARPTPSPTPRPTPTPTPTPCTPDTPILLRPGNGAVITDPASNPPSLDWAYRITPTCPASGFRIQVATDRTFTAVVAQADVAGSVFSWTPPRALTDCQTYYWHVYPKRADGALGTPTAVWYFSLAIGRCP